MGKLSALFGLFKAGKSVADPALWKTRQITATMLAVVILAIGKVLEVFGYVLPLDSETATAIGAGVIAAVNVVLTITTTKKLGLPAESTNTSVLPSTEEAKPVQPLSEAESALAAVDRDKRIFGDY